MNDHTAMIDAYLDGDLSPTEVARLKDWLAESDEHRRQFTAQALDHLLLRDVLQAAAPVADAESGARSSAPRAMAQRLSRSLRYFSRPVPLSIFAATAVLAMLLAALAVVAVPWRQTAFWSPAAAPEELGSVVAQLVDLQDAQWADGQAGTHRDALLRAGQTLHLRQGLAVVEFTSGAKVVVEGPTQLRLDSANASRLVAGNLVAHVPPKAAGHRVRVHDVVVTDLGTRFSVAIEGDEASVEVFQGSVEVAPDMPSAGEPTILREGFAARFTARGGLVARRPAAPRPFRAQAALLDRGFQLSGQIRFLPSPPASVAEGNLESNGHLFIFAERGGFVLPRDVDAYLVQPREGDAATLKAAAVTAGTRVSSYLVHMDLVGREQNLEKITTRAASVQFDQPVLAVIYDSQQLTSTDAVLGAPQTQYEVDESIGALRGLEPHFHDELHISADGRTVRVVAALVNATDQFRVLVASGEP